MHREIESAVRSYTVHDDSLTSSKKTQQLKLKYKDVDKFAHVKRQPLYYTKKSDTETVELLKSMKQNESKIQIAKFYHLNSTKNFTLLNVNGYQQTEDYTCGPAWPS